MLETALTYLLAKLADKATDGALSRSGRRIKESLVGSEHKKALNASFHTGLKALVASSKATTQEELNLLDSIFSDFLEDAEVIDEFTMMLRGRLPDVALLAEIFEDKGYVIAQLPGFEFEQGIVAFVQGFIEKAEQEEPVREILKMAVLRKSYQESQLHTRLLTDIRDAVEAGNAAPPVLSAAKTHSYEALYLRALLERCDHVELTDIDESHTQEEDGFTLIDVYTNMHLANIWKGGDIAVSDAIHGVSHGYERMTEDERLPVKAVEAVAAVQRLVVLGQPGSGKSTLVHHLVAQLARGRLNESTRDETMTGWQNLAAWLPVRIVLRRFAGWIPSDRTSPSESLVWDYIAYLCEDWGCEEYFPALKEHIANGQGMVFFDGLDEVAEKDATAKRSLITDTIEKFAAQIPKSKVLVTCRTYAYTEKDEWRLDGERFPVVTLAPLNQEQIQQFVNTWYKHTGPSKGWDKKQIEHEGAVLIGAVANQQHLQELGQYPLLLTLMAQVHARGGLPDNRADLYNRAVNLLLARWDNRIIREVKKETKVDPGIVARFGIKESMLRGILAEVAYNAHEDQETQENRAERAADIPRETLRDAFEREVDSLDTARKIMEYIQERAGLLQARDNGTYAFPHRTFQEYLAATHIIKRGDAYEVMADAINRDLHWWREVFLLAAGASGMPLNVAQLADRVLGVEDKEMSESEANKLTLVAQSLWETEFLKQQQKEAEQGGSIFTSILTKVQDGLMEAMGADERLLPALRVAAGNALARIGDPRPGVTDLNGIEFCHIPAGEFTMGLPEDKTEYEEDKGVHLVTLTRRYWMARFPITVGQFRRYWEASGKTAEDSSAWDGVPNHPVVNVNWDEATNFCLWVNETLRDKAEIYLAQASLSEPVKEMWTLIKNKKIRATLPSEAEWERAARGPKGDNEYPYAGKADPNKMNCTETGIGSPSPVGCFPSGTNEFGIEELSGNVWEWCRDWYSASIYQERMGQKVEDPVGPESGDSRVLRGGSFVDIRQLCRCAVRVNGSPSGRLNFRGFRVVLLPTDDR